MSKVCSGCGGAAFYVTEQSHRVIYVDGDGKIIDADEPVVDNVEYPMTCTTCGKKSNPEDTVPESFFHEIIAVHAKTTPPTAETLTTEQRHLMWASSYTFMEGDYKEMHAIKSREQKFGIIDFDEVYGLLRSDKKVLIVHMDGTHVLNFSTQVAVS